MRKILLIIVSILLLLFLTAWFFIPVDYTIRRTVFLKAPLNMVRRSLSEKEKWKHWWPEEAADINYHQDNFIPVLEPKLRFDAGINAGQSPDHAQAFINLVPLNDSVAVTWEGKIETGRSFTRKLEVFFFRRKVRSEVDLALQNLKLFVENEERFYGLKIEQQRLTDSTLISFRKELDHYPTTGDIYSLADELKTYALKEGANPTNPPMVYVQKADSVHLLMVGLPLDKKLKGQGLIETKRMVLGNILVSQVKGGDATVQKAMREMDRYMMDHGRVAPAIPYASLITDRRLQPDTTQWITRLCFPVY